MNALPAGPLEPEEPPYPDWRVEQLRYKYADWQEEGDYLFEDNDHE